MKQNSFFTLLLVFCLFCTTSIVAQNIGQPQSARYSNSSIEGLNIYPNPVMMNSKIYIESSKNQPKEIELYNVVGKKMLSVTTANKELTLPYSVNAGIYIMKIREDNATATRKIIVK